MSLRRHTVYNLAGAAVPLALALLTVPMYVEALGVARYGVLALVWLILSYFGLFDLGLGAATAQHLARVPPEGAGQRATVFRTALVISLGTGLAVGLCFWPLAHLFFSRSFVIDESLRPELVASVPWMALAAPLATTSSVLSGSLQGRGKFFELNQAVIFGTALGQVLPLIAARYLGAELTVVLPALVLSRMAWLGLLMLRCQVLVGGSSARPDWGAARSLMRFGSWVTVSGLMGPLMHGLDRFLIGALSGARAVSEYSIPFQLAQATTMLSAGLNSALFPRWAAAAPGADRRQLAQQSMQLVAVVTTPLVAFGLVALGPFLAWWISREMAHAATLLGQVLLLGFWINGQAQIPYTRLQATGRPDLVAKCHLAELLPYLLLLYMFLREWGPLGAAIVFSVRAGADFVLLSHFSRTLDLGVRLLALPLTLLVAIFLASGQLSAAEPWRWSVGLALVVAALAWSARHALLLLRGRSGQQP